MPYHLIELIKLIKIHPVLWAVLGAGGLAGMFKEMAMLLVIVTVHELGHALPAKHFGWRLRRIMLMPFGGVAEVDEYGNRPAREELIVTLSGPAQHIWLILLSQIMSGTFLWSELDHRLFLIHNTTVLLFNLLPILPLDGGKLLFILHSYYLPFQKSYTRTFRLSCIILGGLTSVTVFFLPFHLNLAVIISFLWLHQYLEWKQRHYHFLRFLLERKRLSVTKRLRPVYVPPSFTVAEAVKAIYRENEVVFLLTATSTDKPVTEREVINAYFNREKQSAPLSFLA